jgi:hypothetical protein
MTNFLTTDNTTASTLATSVSATPNTEEQTHLLPNPAHPHLSARAKYVEDPEAFGYQEAGRHLGEATAFENFLHRFESGAIIDASQDEAANQIRRAKLEADRDAVLSQRVNITTQRTHLTEVLIPAQQNTIATHKAQIEQLILDQERGRLRSEFKPIKVGLLTALLVCNVAYLLLFYANLLFTIFFKDYDALIKSGQADLNTLLGTVFDPSGIFTWKPVLIFCYLAPTLFMTLGLAPHFFLNVIGQAKHQKWVKIGFYTLALVFDGLLAYQLESKAHQLRKLIGIEEPFVWYASSMFWIVLGFGFLAYVVCGFLMVVVEKEFDKRDTSRLLETQIGFLKTHITEAEAKIIELQGQVGELDAQLGQLDLQLDALKRRIEAITLQVGSLRNTLQAFYAGWLRYLNNGNHYQKRAECDERFRALVAKHAFEKQTTLIPAENVTEATPTEGFKNKVVARFLNSVMLVLILMVGLTLSAWAQKQWVVAIDLSDRIITTPHCATNDQAAIRQAFGEFEVSVRRALVINSKDAFRVKILPQKGSSLDAQTFEKRLSINMAALPLAEKAQKLDLLKKQLTSALSELYQKARFSTCSADYKGVDTWAFFNDVVPFITPNGYHTRLLLLTDGHFDFESYVHTVQRRNQFMHSRFIHNLKGADWQHTAEKQGVGFLPTSRKILGVSVTVKGIRAKSADIFELDKLRYFWAKWLTSCGIQRFELSQ